jgi:4-hydroxy-4-methyl-2-oxoglutarate aldolase
MLKAFADLSTPLLADACVRSDVPLRAAPPGIGAVVPGHRIAGRALPARHYGSVDVFLEAVSRAEPGDVLVIDNGGRSDEACVGDLAVLEAEAAGLAGLWCGGCTATRRSLWRSACRCSATAATRPGRCGWTSGRPRRWPPRGSGRTWSAATTLSLVTATACCSWPPSVPRGCLRRRTRSGKPSANRPAGSGRGRRCASRRPSTLRQQTAFDDYLARRAADPSYTFRRHLRRIGGAIEE